MTTLTKEVMSQFALSSPTSFGSIIQKEATPETQSSKSSLLKTVLNTENTREVFKKPKTAMLPIAIGTLAGAFIGAVGGAAVGFFFGPHGMIVGATIGAGLGAYAGGSVSKVLANRKTKLGYSKIDTPSKLSDKNSSISFRQLKKHEFDDDSVNSVQSFCYLDSFSSNANLNAAFANSSIPHTNDDVVQNNLEQNKYPDENKGGNGLTNSQSVNLNQNLTKKPDNEFHDLCDEELDEENESFTKWLKEIKNEYDEFIECCKKTPVFDGNSVNSVQPSCYLDSFSSNADLNAAFANLSISHTNDDAVQNNLEQNKYPDENKGDQNSNEAIIINPAFELDNDEELTLFYYVNGKKISISKDELGKDTDKNTNLTHRHLTFYTKDLDDYNKEIQKLSQKKLVKKLSKENKKNIKTHIKNNKKFFYESKIKIEKN